jgi:hypothetical protein
MPIEIDLSKAPAYTITITGTLPPTSSGQISNMIQAHRVTIDLLQEARKKLGRQTDFEQKVERIFDEVKKGLEAVNSQVALEGILEAIEVKGADTEQKVAAVVAETNAALGVIDVQAALLEETLGTVNEALTQLRIGYEEAGRVKDSQETEEKIRADAEAEIVARSAAIRREAEEKIAATLIIKRAAAPAEPVTPAAAPAKKSKR